MIRLTPQALARIIHNPKRKRGIATLPLAYASGYEQSATPAFEANRSAASANGSKEQPTSPTYLD